MQTIFHACASFAIAIGALGYVNSCFAQQSTTGEPPSPPPVMKFGDRQFEALPANQSTETDATVIVNGEASESIMDSNPSAPDIRQPVQIVPQSPSEPAGAVPVIQPASHLEPLPTDPMTTAQQVIQIFDVTRTAEALPGKPISIGEALSGATIESRSELIHAYWSVFERWARRVAVQTEVDRLSELSEPGSPIELELVESARLLAKARLIECELDLDLAQRRLAQFVPPSEPGVLPLAKDLPLVNEYVTNFATMPNQAMTHPRLGQIDRALPKTLEILQARGDAVARCNAVVRQAIQAFNQRQMPLSSALEAIRMLRESQFEFIRTTLRYNQDIAEYALAVAPIGQPADQVVAMLIKSPRRTSQNNPALVSALVPTESRGANGTTTPRSFPSGAPIGTRSASNLPAIPSELTAQPAGFRSLNDSPSPQNFASPNQMPGNTIPGGNANPGALRPAAFPDTNQLPAGDTRSPAPPRYPSNASSGGNFPFGNQ
jgi:hypothetical protein